MVEQRSWSISSFTDLLRHPFQLRFAQRLLWLHQEPERPPTVFRIAEDLSFANVDDETWLLPTTGDVRLVHPFDLDTGVLQRWQARLTDYAVAAPFEQLTRSPSVADETSFASLVGREIAADALARLRQHGWHFEYGLAEFEFLSEGSARQALIRLRLPHIAATPHPPQRIEAVSVLLPEPESHTVFVSECFQQLLALSDEGN